MAHGARRVLDCDIAVAVTGVAGPERDERDNPVGVVYVALATPGEIRVTRLELGSGPTYARSGSAEFGGQQRPGYGTPLSGGVWSAVRKGAVYGANGKETGRAGTVCEVLLLGLKIFSAGAANSIYLMAVNDTVVGDNSQQYAHHSRREHCTFRIPYVVQPFHPVCQFGSECPVLYQSPNSAGVKRRQHGRWPFLTPRPTPPTI